MMILNTILFFGIMVDASPQDLNPYMRSSLLIKTGREANNLRSSRLPTYNYNLRIFKNQPYQLFIEDDNGETFDFLPPDLDHSSEAYCTAETPLGNNRNSESSIKEWRFIQKDGKYWIAKKDDRYVSIINNQVVMEENPSMQFKIAETVEADEFGNRFVSFLGVDDIPITASYCKYRADLNEFTIISIEMTFKFALVVELFLDTRFNVNYESANLILTFPIKNKSNKIMTLIPAEMRRFPNVFEIENTNNDILTYFETNMKLRNQTFGKIVNNVYIKNMHVFEQGLYKKTTVVIPQYTCVNVEIYEFGFTSDMVVDVAMDLYLIGLSSSEINWIKANIIFSNVGKWELKQANTFYISFNYNKRIPFFFNELYQIDC